MQENIMHYRRKNFIEPGEIYFWTATINNWMHLLKDDQFKEIIINSLRYLSEAGKIDVFGFVLMPSHIHLIWRILELNGKETAQGSLLKYTAHEFKKLLIKNSSLELNKYKVQAKNKKYEFWKGDSLAVILYTKEVAFQKLDYTHYNPAAGKWALVSDPCDYKYSSAAYYESSIKNFDFLKDLRDEF